jgi:hypothetical protein
MPSAAPPPAGTGSAYSLGVAGASPLAFSMAEDGSVRRLGCADQRCVAG